MGAGRLAELQVGLAGVDIDSSTGIPVRPVAAVGSVFCATMTAPVNNPDTDTTEIWDSATGAKLIEIYPLTDIATGEAMIAGWSTTSGDANVEAYLGSAIVAHATATGVQYANQRPATKTVNMISIPWDGTTTIKRFACISTAAGTPIVYQAVITY